MTAGSITAGPTAAPSGPVRAFLRLVVIEHSVFALPFAYLAALTAMRPHFRLGTLLLITVAMVAARSLGMVLNRIIDRHVDAANPRTAGRELVTGVVSLRTAWAGAVVSLAAFLGAAAALGLLPLLLAPLAVAPLVVYPYAKRFTDYPHAVLGLAQAVAPVGAWIAVTGHWSWPAVLLGLAVGSWIGGFDLIYACQDVAADRQNQVRSVPARFGVATALRASTAVHVATFGLFTGFGAATGFGPLWYAGLAVTAAAFAYQHRIVTPGDLSRVNRAFFTSNGVVAVVLGLVGVADLVTRW